MKTTAPYKIHIQPNAHDRWFEGNIPNGLPNGLFIEYTHTDSFVDKACEWIRNNYHKYPSEDCADTTKFVMDFRKYMKGE